MHRARRGRLQDGGSRQGYIGASGKVRSVEVSDGGVILRPIVSNGIRLYVGGSTASVRGERVDLTGYRCFTAAHPPVKIGHVTDDPNEIIGLLDSGAFSDPPEGRLTPEGALERQIAWERRFSEMTGKAWMAELLASYDLLIDEKWGPAGRRKERWSVAEGERAVAVTVAAARYLASRRRDVLP